MRILLLIGSLLGLYTLPHFMLQIVPVGLGFALIMIASSRPAFTKQQLMSALGYIAISVGTYSLLMSNQPWETLFGWIPEDLQKWTGVPVSPCSVIMSVAGAWLLPGKTAWRKYLLVTLLLQIPLSMVFHFRPVTLVFEQIAKVLRYTNEQTSAHQAWQFLWMANYYLPVFMGYSGIKEDS